MTLSYLAIRVATLLREAGDDGMSLTEIETAAGTRWAQRHITALCRNGYVIGEQSGRYFLVHEPDVEQESPSPIQPAEDIKPTLFAVSSSPYQAEAA
jgi:hypothetical protein